MRDVLRTQYRFRSSIAKPSRTHGVLRGSIIKLIHGRLLGISLFLIRVFSMVQVKHIVTSGIMAKLEDSIYLKHIHVENQLERPVEINV